MTQTYRTLYFVLAENIDKEMSFRCHHDDQMDECIQFEFPIP